MNKPFYNAILAAGYITTLVLVMNLVSGTLRSQEDNIFMPITMLALLVLSVAVMAFLFFYQPVLLLIEGKRGDAVKLFLTTVSIFAVITVFFSISAMYIIP